MLLCRIGPKRQILRYFKTVVMVVMVGMMMVVVSSYKGEGGGGLGNGYSGNRGGGDGSAVVTVMEVPRRQNTQDDCPNCQSVLRGEML